MLTAMLSHDSLFTAPVPTDFLRDESRKTGTAEAIAFPQSVGELAAAVRAAAACGEPLTIQGARTGISAGAVPEGGMIVSLSKMDRLLGFRTDAHGQAFLRVQPGISLAALRRSLAADSRCPFPVFFPPDPTETSASLGGMAACNSSGACSYAYGATRDHIEALTLVLADGDILTLRRGQVFASGHHFLIATDSGRVIEGELPHLKMPSAKSAAGYWIKPDMDMLDLFIGSEGTLAIIAELELRLRPKPFATLGVLCYFDTEDQALTCVESLRANASSVRPHILAAMEYFDAGSLRLIRGSASSTGLLLPHPEPHWNVALYIEWALASDAPEPADLTCRLLAECGGHADDTWLAANAPSLEKLKAFRHAVPEQVNALIAERKRAYPSLTKLGTDLSVPDDKLKPILRLYRNDLNTAGLEHVIFGHIGNNHVHVNILPRDMEEYATGKRLYRKWAEQVVAWGGSVSAEHGIGRLKKDLLAIMYGADAIDAMRQLKARFDPACQLNPGRLFDAR